MNEIICYQIFLVFLTFHLMKNYLYHQKSDSHDFIIYQNQYLIKNFLLFLLFIFHRMNPIGIKNCYSVLFVIWISLFISKLIMGSFYILSSYMHKVLQLSEKFRHDNEPGHFFFHFLLIRQIYMHQRIIMISDIPYCLVLLYVRLLYVKVLNQYIELCDQISTLSINTRYNCLYVIFYQYFRFQYTNNISQKNASFMQIRGNDGIDMLQFFQRIVDLRCWQLVLLYNAVPIKRRLSCHIFIQVYCASHNFFILKSQFFDFLIIVINIITHILYQIMSHINQREQLLSRQLNAILKNLQAGIYGVENSVLLKMGDSRKLLTINCYSGTDKKINYELCIIELQALTAKRVPVYIINEEDIQKDFLETDCKIKLKFSQNPRTPNHFFIHVQKQQAIRSDKIFISILNLDNLQQLDKMMCYCINAKYRAINKVKWHKFSSQCLCVLYDQLQFQIYNYRQSPTLAKSCIDLKYLKSKTPIKDKKKFVDFCFSLQPTRVLDKFTIYFQTNTSTTFACFPVIADQIKLTSREIRQLQEKSDKNDDYALLKQAIPSEIIQKEIGMGQTIYAIKLNDDAQQDDNRYCYLQPCNNFGTNKNHSQSQQKYSTLFVVRIGDLNMAIQSGITSDQSNYFFRFSFLSHESQSVKYAMHPIVFHECQLTGLKDKLPMLLLQEQLLDNNMFYSNGQQIIQLNIQGLYQGIITKNLINEKSCNLIHLSLLVRLTSNETMKCLALTDQFLYIVRSDRKNDRFNNIPLYSLGIINQLNTVLQNFEENVQNSLKFQGKNTQQLKKIKHKTQDANQRKKFQVKQLDKIKEASITYASNIKNLINHEARSIVKLYEKSQQLQERFNDKFRKRKELYELIAKASQNNQKIKQLVSREPHQSNQRETVHDRTDDLSSKLRLMQRNINAIKETRKKQFEFDSYMKEKLQNEADQILQEMKSLRQQLQQIKSQKLGK